MRRSRLSRDHKKMLLAHSGINARLVVQRGYRTVERKAELERLGFGRAQRNVPTLLVPIHGPTGGPVLYQARPDQPRIKNGKQIKYETPGGERMALDVHPSARDRLGDPQTPLFVTEGVKKGDALVSCGLCAVALIGVWNWRGTNGLGGKTALPEWEYVALNGRKVYVVFDSDVMEKREVYSALSRLKGFLEHRGAEVLLVYLPPCEGGKKQGVDDYLAGGKGDNELLALATPELRHPPQGEPAESPPYRKTSGGLVWDKPTENGSVSKPLANFVARIVADVSEDDGAEVRRRFEIEAAVNDRSSTFAIPSSQFAGMGWPTEHLGAAAIVYPGFGLKDHARAAIQILSGDVPTRHVYAHTGWREAGGEWVYLHADGAVGRVGRVEPVRTELTGNLAGRALPDPPKGDDLVEAVKASLRLLELAPDKITVPLLSSTCRAAMGGSDFSLHLSGPTGEGKSELAALFQQHFGAGLDARNLTSWESTENAIEGQAFQAKDQVMVLDDFAPTGTAQDVQRWHRKADRVLRAKGNASGRQRMRADTTLRPDKPPRALILSTGEDVPRGQSLAARMVVLELGPGQLDWTKLSRGQKDAAEGLFAGAMAGFVRWMASRYGRLLSGRKEEHAALREAASTSIQHRRTPSIVADLALGLRHFLVFASEVGALSEAEAWKFWAWGWRALGEAAAAQSQHQGTGEPTRRFGELLEAAIASGRAHLAGKDGGEPPLPEAWGWRHAADGWRPQGKRIGWADGEEVYLEPEASFAAAQEQGRDSGDALVVTSRTLRKRLHERGLLASTDAHTKRQALTVRRTLSGSRREVLHASKHFLSIRTDHEPDQPDQVSGEPHTGADSTPPLWSGWGIRTQPEPDHEPDQEPDGESGGRVEHVPWPGNGRKPDHEPDQRSPLTHVENAGNGWVGRVFNTQRTEGASDEERATCTHGYPGGNDCYLCDPEHPYRRQQETAKIRDGRATGQ